jgi:hypothetical protein
VEIVLVMNDARVKKQLGVVHLWLAYLFFSREQKRATALVLIIC